ncbi:K(+)-transporting ATPase subunit C [Edaphocola aurantiacus]|uniref:K(+)-transporting ATPase subunit C n=1 Tax=Edaphocola aurantiacus TaxID=2601682 RepID=UPI001C95BE79|nr:K(+)-transporting ATPase subunit C [Edaphocola aurantiacus]
MKTYFFPALRLTIVLLIVCAVLYPLSIWLLGKMAPGQGKGVQITAQGRNYYRNIGQSFTEVQYFQGRPSAVGYNAAGSGGSNKGPSNPEYLDIVQGRIDTFLKYNPGVQKHDIPADLVTASGSGLDPDISVASAVIQVPRIAAKRSVPESELKQLIQQHTQKPLWGLFGPERVNVLELNIALDKLSKS